MATAAVEEIRATSYVGFDSITSQIEHKLLKRGFQFNVIVVGALLGLNDLHFLMVRNIGQTGLGKSTLINTIFASHLIDSKGRLNADEPVRQTTEIQAVSHSEFRVIRDAFDLTHASLVIVENGVRLRLNIVDTPGYGDQINNENWYVVYLTFCVHFIYGSPAGIPLSSISRTSIARISARNSRPCVTATFRIPESIVAYTSSAPLDTHFVPLM